MLTGRWQDRDCNYNYNCIKTYTLYIIEFYFHTLMHPYLKTEALYVYCFQHVT